jgi:hypothetical protein
MRARTQWLSKTRSIPYWTTGVFSSAWRLMNEDFLPTELTEEWRLTYERTGTLLSLSLSLLSVLTCPPFYNFWKTERDHHLEQLVVILVCCHGNVLTEPLPSKWTRSLLFVAAGTWLPNRCSAMDVLSGSTISAIRLCLLNCCLAIVIFVTA